MAMAAAEGVVDFTRIDWERPEDRLNLRLRLEGLVAKWRRQELETYVRVYTSLAERSQEAFHKLVEILEEYEGCYRPRREGQQEKTADRSIMDRLMRLWEERFGKLDDQATQEGIRQTVQELTQRRLEEKRRRQRAQTAKQKLIEQIRQKERGRGGRK